MSTVDKKAIIEEEKKKLFAKPIVTANPTFEVKQIDDFYTLFNLYADNRRQADIREIVSTAKTLGYDQSHEYIFKGLVDIADQFDGEWVGFEAFLEALTHTVVIQSLFREMGPPKKAGDRLSLCWIEKVKAGLLSRQ